ncbi:LacI family DNA-binding transcriptional regulator [Flindersiella endophytica]
MTIREIARVAGVSKSTVSLVLNNSPKVDPATRDHVLAVMREHNYVPNFQATSLAKGSSPFIGILVPGLSWGMVAAINFGVASVLEPTPYEIILYTSTNERDYSNVVDRILATRLSAGLLVVTHYQPLEPIVELRNHGLPVVVVNTLSTPVDLPCVEADNYTGGCLAARHLLELGHTRIATIQGPMTYRCCRERHQGFRDTLTEAGVKPNNRLVKQGGFDPDTTRDQAKELLSLSKPPTAIFTHNDNMAYAVMQAAADCGLRIPEDLSLVGFDDNPSSTDVRPALTTVKQPFREMGRHAAELLLAEVEAGGEPNKQADNIVRMPTELVVRASTARLST